MADDDRPRDEGTTGTEGRQAAPPAPAEPVIDLTREEGPVLDLTGLERQAEAPPVEPGEPVTVVDLTRPAPTEAPTETPTVIDLTVAAPAPLAPTAAPELEEEAAAEAVRAKRAWLSPRAWRAGFRRFRRTRPFWAGVWTMLGGTVIAYVPATAIQFVFSTTSIATGIAVGAIIGFCGLLLWVQPQLRVLLGVVILVLSLVSFITSDFGGFFLGMILAIIGGSLATAWSDAPVAKHRRRHRLVRRLVSRTG